MDRHVDRNARLGECVLISGKWYKMDAAKRAGTLELVLEAFEPEPLPVSIVYSPRKPIPLKLRAFLDWMTPRLKARLAFGDDDN